MDIIHATNSVKNIRLLLALCPVQISGLRHLFPPHRKSNQRVPPEPTTLGKQIKQHHLELHWLQTDVAANIGTSSTSVTNWERGSTSPSRRMTKRIQEFLLHAPKQFPKFAELIFHARLAEFPTLRPKGAFLKKFVTR